MFHCRLTLFPLINLGVKSCDWEGDRITPLESAELDRILFPEAKTCTNQMADFQCKTEICGNDGIKGKEFLHENRLKSWYDAAESVSSPVNKFRGK